MLVTLQNLEKEGHIPENRTMEEVFNSSKDLNGFIDNMPAWVQVCSLDGMVELANRAALEISGYQLSEMGWTTVAASLV